MDGYHNLAEFALLLTPTLPDPDPVLFSPTTPAASEGSWSATIRSDLPQGVVSWEFSRDLVHWDIAAEGVDYDVGPIQDNGDGSSTVTYVVSPVHTPACFLRLLVR